GLLVDLRDAVVCRGRAAHIAPAVRLQSGPHRDCEAVDLDPTPIHEPRGFYRRRLDDRGLAGLVREPVRHWDIFELASSRLGRRGRASSCEREEEQSSDRVSNVHDLKAPQVVLEQSRPCATPGVNEWCGHNPLSHYSLA